MVPRILVVDRNEAFATMLEEMLTMEGAYDVQVAHHDRDALLLLQQADFDLTVLDMDLGPGGDYQDLIRSIRQIRPTMRVMLIPLMGQDLPPEADSLDIQGTLAKPFFADDLSPSIGRALAKNVRVFPPTPAAQPMPQPALARSKSSPPAGEPAPEIRSVLSDLARETGADLVLLLSDNPEGPGVVSHVSTLSSDKVGTFAGLILTMVQAAQAVRHFLGEPGLAFEHNMFEGQHLRLTVMFIPPVSFLVAVTPMSAPLGMVRHNLRRASRNLIKVALT